MIIDAFIFFNERELCELRIRLLAAAVDRFVVIEADTTFAGKEKEFVFPELMDGALNAFREKILYYPMQLEVDGLHLDYTPLEFDGNSDHFRLEAMQRNAIDSACSDFGFSEDDWLIISDADEIPDPRILNALRAEPDCAKRLPLALQQHMFYYNLNWLRDEDWRGSIVTTVGNSRGRSAQWHRNQRFNLPYVAAAGWHMSYFGDAMRVRQKLEAFSHQELNQDEIKGRKNVESRMRDGSDLFGRDVAVTRVGEEFFPASLLAAASRNSGFFWGGA